MGRTESLLGATYYIFMCVYMYVYVPCLDAMAMAATLGMGVAITIAHGQANTRRINPIDRK